MADIVDVRVNLKDVEDGLKAMQEAASELGRVFRALVPFAKRDIADHASQEAGPDGPWPTRAMSTQARLQDRARLIVTRTQTTRGRRSAGFRVAAGAKIITRKRATNKLGTLPRSNRYSAGQDGLVAKSPIAWAEAQRDGGTVGRGSVLPSRDWLWWSDPFVDTAVGAIEDYVIRPWKKGGTAFRVRPGVRVG